MSANYVQQPVLLAATGGAVALVVAFPFMMLIDVASDSILFCRTVQKMRQGDQKISAIQKLSARSLPWVTARNRSLW